MSTWKRSEACLTMESSLPMSIRFSTGMTSVLRTTIPRPATLLARLLLFQLLQRTRANVRWHSSALTGVQSFLLVTGSWQNSLATKAPLKMFTTLAIGTHCDGHCRKMSFVEHAQRGVMISAKGQTRSSRMWIFGRRTVDSSFELGSDE